MRRDRAEKRETFLFLNSVIYLFVTLDSHGDVAEAGNLDAANQAMFSSSLPLRRTKKHA